MCTLQFERIEADSGWSLAYTPNSGLAWPDRPDEVSRALWLPPVRPSDARHRGRWFDIQPPDVGPSSSIGTGR